MGFFLAPEKADSHGARCLWGRLRGLSGLRAAPPSSQREHGHLGPTAAGRRLCRPLDPVWKETPVSR